MAVLGISVRVYGEVNEQAPYVPDTRGNLPGVSASYDSASRLPISFDAARITAYPIADPGCVMAGSVSCYAVIEVPATGLNQIPKRYVVQQTVAAITSARNA